ncbi:hypothetical protein HY045_01515 [Candidatus Woesebacteria bacterium]|nr:hypothetical protein [Candidatus Woesebacteria bacterium]
MLSARRLRIRRPKKKGVGLLSLILLLSIGLAFLVWNLFFRTRYWRGDNKLNLVVKGPFSSVTILSFDPKSGEINKFIIPGDTEVKVSRGLGNFRLKNIWQLGMDEKLEGKLLAETVAKNFSAPVYVWADSPALGFGKSFLETIDAIFSPYKTNLTFSDKIRLGIFSLSVKNNNVSQIELIKTGFLRKTQLKDGDYGYVILNEVPRELVLALSNPMVANKNLKVQINDFSSDLSVEESIGKIFEVLGTKVSSFNKDGEADIDCEVGGTNKDLVQEISKIFGCNINPEKSDFDTEFTIGKKFILRY